MIDVNKYLDFGVSRENLMEDLYRICAWERLSGTSEELESFQYVERELKKAGIETELILHDAYISLPKTARLFVDGKEVVCHTASMAKSTPPEGICGTLVFFEDANLLTEERCRGKIVLLGGVPDFEKIHRAWKKGARGIIGSSGKYFHEKIISNAWGSPTPQTLDLIPDIPYVSVIADDMSTLQKIAQERCVTAHLTTVVDTGWKKIPLLTATVRAEHPTEKYVMFTGHIDSWYHGATDNGTANCVQLEMARIARKNRSALKRNLKVVWYSGHSHGRYAGSAWHVDNNWQDIHDNCVLHINADIIGGEGATDLSRSIIMPEVRDVAASFIKAHTGCIFNGGRCGRNGDQSYYIAGVSSAFSSFSKQPRPENPENKLAQTRSGAYDFGWWWHTEHDLTDKVDPEFFLRDAKIYISVGMCYLLNPTLPLDFSKTAVELKELIELWAKKAEGRFDLGLPVKLTGELVVLCERMYACSPTEESHQERFNDTVLQLARILVPLNYTTGNLYENDSGIPLPPVPSLAQIDDLPMVPRDSNEEKEILVALTQRRNYVIHSLNRAIRVLNNYLS